ncbi:squalene--hopene cyclase [Candidatus Poriferisocius sp.]|uniref:squalene--hopene cyclase n=1 Tax=Candidatus Poriferisocius sp. TaxID=3101276 RepID=UPI003B5CDD93
MGVEQCLTRARDRLLSLQDIEGWWKDELETNVSIEAEDLFLREFLGVADPEITRQTANWIRHSQRSDGTWSTYYQGQPDLSVTVEAYWALRYAGDPADAPHMTKAAAYIRDAGGLERSRVFTRIWMALFGLWRWEDLPALPPEVILLPKQVPLNIYDFACWARQTVVALTVVGAHRPVHSMGISLDEIRTGATPAEREPAPPNSVARRFQLLDGALHVYEKHAPRKLREWSLRRAEQWIIARQEADGCWGGIQPPWVYSLLALYLRGYSLHHPIMARGLAGFDGWTIIEDDMRRLECCQSPVWDTCLALIALADAGVDPGDQQMVAGARWLLDQEVQVVGDWSEQRPHLAPGGWAFEFENSYYPDLDDTAEVALALRRIHTGDAKEVCDALDRAVVWTQGMQCSDGGWAAFDADNCSPLVAELPFCDFGEVIDPPSADVTAHVVEMLCELDADKTGMPVNQEAVARGLQWLSDAQEDDGSWYGRWGANHIYGTGAVVPALISAGVSADDDRVVRACQWLESVQNGDGGWGEDMRSYVDQSWRGRGESTPSQTAWALLALIAAGRADGEAAHRGVAWLVANQRSDGDWDEPWYTGTGFSGDFYIRYHLYRLVFPVMALGRWVRATSGQE